MALKKEDPTMADIWYIEKKQNGKWDYTPINAGAVVNTAGNEAFPYVVANTLIFASMNTTTSSVKIEPAKEDEQKKQNFKTQGETKNSDIREMPLPYLNIIEGINHKSDISEKTINNLPLQDKNTNDGEYIHPYIFQEDLYTPDGGDDFILFEILKNYFIQEKYDQAFISLQHLTKTNIDEKVLNRAIFYMGQSLYFCANYEEAITTFVKVAEIYPELTKKWIVLSLDALNLPN